MNDGLITTEEVLARLNARGLKISRNMLVQDVRAGYLPALIMEPRGDRKGIGRLWEEWAVRRAIYLYRLRRKGARGQVLRVLLFFWDGWGWEEVRPICLAGLRKTLRIQVSPVLDHLYKQITSHDLDAFADNIAADAGFNNPELARFIWGMGFFGKPLDEGSMRPLAEAFEKAFQVEPMFPIETAEHILTRSNWTYKDIIRVVEEADCEQADRARSWLRLMFHQWRRLAYLCWLEKKESGVSTNLLTCGGRSAKTLATGFRAMSGRITPAQFLASFLVTPLFLERILTPEEYVFMLISDWLNVTGRFT